MPHPLPPSAIARAVLAARVRVAAFVRGAALFIGLIAASGAAAQDAPHERLDLQSPASLRRYSYDEGLPQASVNAIVRTRDGFLWLGTFGGLVRFDGREFRVFRSGGAADGEHREGPSSERVLALHEDARQRLWIGTQEAGISLYEHGRFRHLPICGGACQVNRLFSSDGHDVWVMATTGILRVDPDTLEATAYDDSYDAFAVFAQAGGESFVGGLSGFGRASARGIERLHLPDGFTIVRRMGSDGTSVWVIVENGSLYRYDVAAERWTFIRAGVKPEAQLVSDGGGHVYLSDETSGIRRLGHDGAEHPLAGAQTLHAATAYADDGGNLWIGSTSKGLYRLRPARLSLLRSTAAAASPGRVLARDGRDGLWLVHGCSSLSHRAADGSQTAWATKPIGDTCIGSLLYDAASDTLWIGTSGSELLRLKSGRLEKMAAWPRSGPVSVWMAKDGTLWVATARFVGRLRLTGEGDVAGVETIAALGDNLAVASIVDARAGGVWVVGDRGAFRIVGNDIAERWTPAEGIRGRYFRALHEDADGVLWIGTYGAGLVRIEHGVVRQYTEANGLFDDTVSCILPDGEGRLWMAGNRGISVFFDPHIGADGPNIRTLSASDGLDPPEFNGGTAPPCLADGAGRLWFSMVVGFAMADPVSMLAPASTRTPTAYIDHATVSRRRLDLSAPADLDANASQLEIGFGAIDLVDPDKVRFRYRLGGDDWIDAGSNRSVLLPVVPWGPLDIEVQARELGGNWSSSATLRLNRPVPWYRHQWIWLATSLASLLALLWMTRERRHSDLDDALLARLRELRARDS